MKTLLNYLKETPQDPFLLYAIATEYRSGSAAKAKEYFDRLIKDFPDYLPTYYQAAHLYWEAGDRLKAGELFERGIELARAKNEQKTLAELQNAYMNMQLDDD